MGLGCICYRGFQLTSLNILIKIDLCQTMRPSIARYTPLLYSLHGDIKPIHDSLYSLEIIIGSMRGVYDGWHWPEDLQRLWLRHGNLDQRIGLELNVCYDEVDLGHEVSKVTNHLLGIMLHLDYMYEKLEIDNTRVIIIQYRIPTKWERKEEFVV